MRGPYRRISLVYIEGWTRPVTHIEYSYHLPGNKFCLRTPYILDLMDTVIPPCGVGTGGSLYALKARRDLSLTLYIVVTLFFSSSLQQYMRCHGQQAINLTSSMSDFFREFKQATADSSAGSARSRSLCASSAIAFVAAACQPSGRRDGQGARARGKGGSRYDVGHGSSVAPFFRLFFSLRLLLSPEELYA